MEQSSADQRIKHMQFLALFNSIPIGVAIYEARDKGNDFVFVDFNPAAEKIEQIKKEQLIGKCITEVFPGVKSMGLIEVMQRVWATGIPEQHPIAFYADDRIQGWRENYLCKLPSGELLVIYEDRTAAKQAAAELWAEKERLAVTLRSIGDGVITTNEYGRIDFMNRVAENLTGWPLQEARGKELTEVFRIINEKTRQYCKNPVAKVMESGDIVGLANHTALVAKDGVERIIADSGAPIRDRQNKIIGVVLVFRDVTEKQRLEEELQKAEHLEALGVLAGGIAHDFNNMLSGIFGYMDMTREHIKGNRDAIECLDLALTVFQRARDLTQQLLTFAKGGAPSKRTSSLGDLMKDATTFVLSGSRVKPSFDIPSDLWLCDVDAGQLSQVINNLVINAQQAMPMGGTITITARNVVLTSSMQISLPLGNYVKIAVQDTGVGIPQQYLNKLFMPFFTTKQKGCGLGLAVCYSIIKKHDGYIGVTSEPGVGSTFYLYLPATLVEQKEAGPTIKTGLLLGKGKIMVLDDEPFILDVVAKMLKTLGYTPVAIAYPNEAIATYAKSLASDAPIRAAILDLTIPGNQGGKEVCQELLKINPYAKLVVSSGYSEDPIMANPKAYGFQAGLSKPYMLRQLSQVLHEVLQ